MVPSGALLVGSYDWRLVVLSILIAMGASYVALDLAGRMSAASGRARRIWLWCGAAAMGLGIWSMHYIGMLAFQLPVEVLHHLPTVGLSLVAAVLSSGVALFVVGRKSLGWSSAIVGSLVMGGGIACMHYIGMAAMRLPAMGHMNVAVVVLSVVIAVVVSLVALWLAFRFRTELRPLAPQKLASAAVMGVAVASMHYTGMAAMTYEAAPWPADLARSVEVSALGTVGITLVTFMVLALAVLSSMIDRRFSARGAARQASLGVLLRRQGALGEARTQLEAALVSRRQSGQKLAASATLSNLGRVLLDQGELAGAANHFAEALALSREVGNKSGEAHALAGQGEVALAGGDLAAARAQLERALALRTAIGEKINAAETGYQLAVVLLEEGKAPAAVAAAATSRAELAALGAADSRLLGAALLARALLAAGDAAAARAAAAELRAAAAASQSPLVRITCAIAHAETLPPGERARAASDLAAARRQAEDLGLIGLAFEARLAAARVTDGAGRSELTALATEAGGKGFSLIAAKARRATAQPA